MTSLGELQIFSRGRKNGKHAILDNNIKVDR